MGAARSGGGTERDSGQLWPGQTSLCSGDLGGLAPGERGTDGERQRGDVPCVREPEGAGVCNSICFTENPTCMYEGALQVGACG